MGEKRTVELDVATPGVDPAGRPRRVPIGVDTLGSWADEAPDLGGAVELGEGRDALLEARQPELRRIETTMGAVLVGIATRQQRTDARQRPS